MTDCSKPEMLTLTALRERGWTASMIDTLLGEPDAVKKNPRYAKAAPMRLYHETRVMEMENSAEFIRRQEASAPRRAASRKAVETKRDALIRQVRQMTVTVERIPAAEIRRRAIESYESWNDHRDPVAPDADEGFIHRISVNFIRHELTEYDEALEEVAGRVGIGEAVSLIREMVYGAIAEAYPYLKAECIRQMERRNGSAGWAA